MIEKRLFTGLDLGQSSDPSAIITVEASRTRVEPMPVLVESTPMGKQWTYTELAQRPTPKEPVLSKKLRLNQYKVRHIQSIKLGTDYTVIGDMLLDYYSRPPLMGSTLVVDWTGVGKVFVDMLARYVREAWEKEGVKPKMRLRPVGITAGSGYSEDGAGFKVAKKELAGILLAVFGEERIIIPEFLHGKTWEDARLLRREAETFKVKITSSANETFEAWRERDHDDIVLALAIALWVAEVGMKEFWMK